MKKIMFAGLHPSPFNYDENGNYTNFVWEESSEAEYGREWNGNVKAYMLNADYDEDSLNRDYNGTIENFPDGAIVVVDDSGDPSEIWWAEEVTEKDEAEEKDN